MAEEEQSQERTEEPSAKRLKELKEQGQVARSKDFNATFILIFGSGVFWLFGQSLALDFAGIMRQSFEFSRHELLTPDITLIFIAGLMKTGFAKLFPLLLVIFLLTIIAPVLLGGWVFSRKLLQPKFSRMNPLTGLKRMVSAKSMMEMLKAFLKFILVCAVAILVLTSQLPALLHLAEMPLETAAQTGVGVLFKSFMMIAASMILIAAIDVPFQLYEHHKASRMTKQELRDEYKEMEGKPEVKSAIRRAQQEIARRRMMAEVPKANVILTNPTHYAVAISYSESGKKAPVVVAKGKDLIAFQITKVGKEHEVPIVSIPALTRAIYFSTKLNAEIPRGLYIAVAQVLAYIYKLQDKTRYDPKPEFLQQVPIPPELYKEADKDTES